MKTEYVFRCGAFALVAFFACGSHAANIAVATRGAAADCAVVVSATASPTERYAADEFTNYIARMTGVALPIMTDAAALPAKAVVLGRTCHTPADCLPKAEPSGDAFRLVARGGRIFVGGKKRGVLYGAYELLERFGGCRWYASWCETVPARASFAVPDDLVDEQAPAFLMREPFWWDVNKNRDFAARIRVNGYNHTPNDVPEKVGGDDYRFGGGLSSCHTFNTLCDPNVYFDAHPEYFSMIGGERRKVGTQLCLTNPDVLKIVTSNVLARIRKDPGAKFYGVSQNDWYNYCECPACKAIDDAEESHAGTMVRFVNAVAANVEKEFPDAIIETLAYQYTRKPPKITKLRHNVVPCLCTIECDFSRPLTESRYEQNVSFLKDIVGWSAQTERLYVWDYVTNFRRYTMPHANFDALQGNVKCFRDNGVKYLFEQGDSLGRHADFAELKAWLLAKWMWNPDLPEKPLLDDFFAGYYGEAAPQVRAWFEALRAVQRAYSDDPRRPLCIYEKSDYAAITDELLELGAALLAKGAEAVRGDAVRSHNVRMCAFSIDCMRLDRMRVKVGYDLWLSDEPFAVEDWKRSRDLARRVVATLEEVPNIRLAESGSNADMNTAWRAMVTNPPPSFVVGARSGEVGAVRFEGNNPACQQAIVPRADAKGGKALAFFETPWDWCGRYYLHGCRLQAGTKYRFRVHAKVEKATEPVAFRAGVRISDASDKKVDRLVREIPASETSPDWKWYDVGVCTPEAGEFFYVGHAPSATANHRTAEQKILVDRVGISREP